MINDKTYTALSARHHAASDARSASGLALPVIPTDPFRFGGMLMLMVIMKL